MKTIDPTQRSLEAAILDQTVAGTFEDKPYAYAAVLNQGSGKMWAIGIAVEDEAGYNPVAGFEFDTQAEVDAFVDGMNKHIGLTKLKATEIIASSMRRRVMTDY